MREEINGCVRATQRRLSTRSCIRAESYRSRIHRAIVSSLSPSLDVSGDLYAFRALTARRRGKYVPARERNYAKPSSDDAINKDRRCLGARRRPRYPRLYCTLRRWAFFASRRTVRTGEREKSGRGSVLAFGTAIVGNARARCLAWVPAPPRASTASSPPQHGDVIIISPLWQWDRSRWSSKEASTVHPRSQGETRKREPSLLRLLLSSSSSLLARRQFRPDDTMIRSTRLVLSIAVLIYSQ